MSPLGRAVVRSLTGATAAWGASTLVLAATAPVRASAEALLLAAGTLGVWTSLAAALVALVLVRAPAASEGSPPLAVPLALGCLVALVAWLPASWLVPETLSFRDPIARVGAAGLGVVAAALAALRARPRGFAAAGLLLVAARLLLAEDFRAVFLGRELVLEAVTLGALSVAFVPPALPRGALTGAVVAVSVGVALSAVLLFARAGGTHAARNSLSESAPGVADWLAFTRSVYDLDGDGWSALLGGRDCDDTDSRVHPRAVEVVGNGVDDNCAGGDLSAEAFAAAALPASDIRTDASAIVLVTIDSLRIDVVEEAMPELVRFGDAVGAQWFDQAYAQAPFTEDSVGSMFSARWPMAFRHGPDRVALGPTWPGALRAAGWRTWAVVTSHDPGAEVAAGFDTWDDTLAALQTDRAATSSRETTDRALAALARLTAGDAATPFFLWVHYFDPHIDYVPRPDTPFAGEGAWDRYRQEVFTTDREVGRLLAAVRAAGVLERGRVVVTADHGEAFGEKGHLVHALWVDEMVLRVPLLLAGRGVPAGRNATRVRLVDLGATLAGFAGDGEALTFGAAPDRDVFAQSTFRGVWIRAALSGDHKLVEYVQFGTESLYDVARDPGELVDLVDARPADAERMRTLLGRRLDRSLNDRLLGAR